MNNPALAAESDYVRLAADVWARSDHLSLIQQVEGVILDIDGVLIDVGPSFRVAISQTVQHFFFRILGFEGEAVLLRPSETQLFKLAGGFNNDWELTDAAILFYLAKSEMLEAEDIDVIRDEGMTLEEFTSAVRLAGGGFQGAQEVLLPKLTSEQRKRIDKRLDKPGIQKLFQELYGGIDHCKRLYGFDPEYNRRHGLINEERVVIKAETLEPFFPHVAILTGRTKEEAEWALEVTGLAGKIPVENIVTDETFGPAQRKPKPDALIHLARVLGSKVIAYVGDVLDDLMIVKNAALHRDCPAVCLSCMIVSPLRREEVKFYQVEGADVIGYNVNSVLNAIRKES